MYVMSGFQLAGLTRLHFEVAVTFTKNRSGRQTDTVYTTRYRLNHPSQLTLPFIEVQT